MAGKRSRGKTSSFGNFEWKESYSSLILGVIIVVILGLLVANFLSKRNSQIDGGEQTSNTTSQENQQVNNPGGEYKVLTGDSLSAISKKFYGSEDFWPVLSSVNHIPNANIIFTDTMLKIPTRQEAESLTKQLFSTSYQIQSGDTLFSIAEKVYGDGSKWVLLDRANHVGRLTNGNPLIFAGNVLTIPR